MDDSDLTHLRRCVTLAARALDAGDEPFGSVLVDARGVVRREERNRVGGGDQTRHPEFELARWSVAHLTSAERVTATVYTSGEHCPMCSAAHAWVGLGRIVYAVSAAQLTGWRAGWGLPASAVAALPVGQVAPGVEVDGPAPELETAMRVLHARAAGVPPGDDALTTELVGGDERRALVVVAHDPGWAATYDAERRRIVDALGPRARQVEHIGSTAVPGLAAKAIVDVLVTVAAVADEADYLPQLLGAGYRLRTREPGHRMFRTADLGVHVHVLSDGADEAVAYLDLRDRLRRSETARERYTAVKHAVIATGVTDMNVYSDAKSDVIAAIRAGEC